jgi:hypothetical protein
MVYLFKMVIFHGYVKQPDGICLLSPISSLIHEAVCNVLWFSRTLSPHVFFGVKNLYFDGL